MFKSTDVVVHAHVIPSIGTLTHMKTKVQVQLDLDSYFDEFMCIATNRDFPMSANVMQKYVFGPAVYADAMEARVRFQKDVTLEHTNIIKDYRSWHQYVTVEKIYY